MMRGGAGCKATTSTRQKATVADPGVLQQMTLLK
jgi:hypothetical protein